MEARVLILLSEEMYKKLLKAEKDLEMSKHEIVEVCLRRYLEDRATKMLIENKKREREKKEFEYEFKAEGTRKLVPYVAKLTLEDGKFKREFFKLERKNLLMDRVQVRGKYKAQPGDIIEKRTEENLMDNTRTIYEIMDSGEERVLYRVTKDNKSEVFKKVYRRLIEKKKAKE